MQKELLLITAALVSACSYSQTILGFGKTGALTEIAAEKKFDAGLQAKNVDQYIKDLSARPHHVGSAYDQENATYLLNKFKSWGYDTHIETFYVLFPTPKTRLLEMTGTKNFKASLKEP